MTDYYLNFGHLPNSYFLAKALIKPNKKYKLSNDLPMVMSKLQIPN